MPLDGVVNYAEHGLVVYPTDRGPRRWTHAELRGVSGIASAPSAEVLNIVSQQQISLTGRGQVAYNLYSASFNVPNADARLLMILGALETLAPREPREAAEIELLAQWTATLDAQEEMASANRDSLRGGLNALRNKSISQRLRALRPLLDGRTYSGKSAQDAFIVISGIGNALGGGGDRDTPAAGVKDTPAAVVDEPEEPAEEPEPEPEPEMVAVPDDLVGMTATEAANALIRVGLEPNYDGEPEWEVLEVDAKGEVEAGTEVTLTLDEPPALTLAQENAIEEAQRYVQVMPFSRRGLFDQLTSEYGGDYEDADAKFALDYLEDNKLVNWKKEAVEAAESYLDTMSFSRSSLYQQLTSEYGSQFTKKQAEYALEQVGYSPATGG